MRRRPSRAIFCAFVAYAIHYNDNLVLRCPCYAKQKHVHVLSLPFRSVLLAGSMALDARTSAQIHIVLFEKIQGFQHARLYHVKVPHAASHCIAPHRTVSTMSQARRGGSFLSHNVRTQTYELNYVRQANGEFPTFYHAHLARCSAPTTNHETTPPGQLRWVALVANMVEVAQRQLGCADANATQHATFAIQQAVHAQQEENALAVVLEEDENAILLTNRNNLYPKTLKADYLLDEEQARQSRAMEQRRPMHKEQETRMHKREDKIAVARLLRDQDRESMLLERGRLRQRIEGIRRSPRGPAGAD